MTIRFRKEVRFAELLTPLRNYEPEKQVVEHRYDPLTERTTVVTAGRFQYVKRNFESDEQIVSSIAESTKAVCPFCPSQLERSTPRFPSRIVPEGNIVVDDVVLFPGLFAHMDFNAVAVLGKEHYLPPKMIAPEKIYSAFRAGLAYLKRLRESRPEVFYASYAGNYFPLSGSTIIHPHMHVLASDLPLQLQKELLDRSREYFSKQGSNYWLDLINEEEGGERFVGSIEDTVWLTPFAPSSTYEVWAISRSFSDFLDIGEEGFRPFAEGLARVLRFYQEERLSCFNFALYSGPIGEDSDEYFRMGLRVLGRFGYKPPYVSDIWSLQAILMEGEAYDTPENMAQRLKKHFTEEQRT